MSELKLTYRCRMCGAVYESGATTGDSELMRAKVTVSMLAQLTGKSYTASLIGGNFCSPFDSHCCADGRKGLRGLRRPDAQWCIVSHHGQANSTRSLHGVAARLGHGTAAP